MAFIDKVALRDFRNFSQLALRFNRDVNIFVGNNGQGKTNLLESIFLIAKGRSFRSGKNENMISFATNAEHRRAAISAHVFNGDLDSQITLKMTSSQKNYQMNNKKVSSQVLNHHLPCVLFSPDSLAVIKEGPDQRRNLVDELLETQSQASLRTLLEYRRCLRARNRLLREIKSQEVQNRQELISVLHSLNDSFLRLATEMTATRIQSLRNIEHDLQYAMQKISDDTNMNVSVDYSVSKNSAMEWDRNKIYSALRARLQELQGAEIDSGTSLVGPHKHDIQFLCNGNDSRFYCSQGQQRALILSFKMAQIMYHYKVHQMYPILLLDDVMSELDSGKRGRLVQFLKGVDSQIFLTTTELELSTHLPGENLSLFHVKEGRVWS